MEKKEELKKEIAECEERLKFLRKELDKPEYGGKRWKPRLGQQYYHIAPNGDINSYHFTSMYDEGVYEQDNCFKTEEEAEFEVERRKVIAELSDFAEGDDAMWGGDRRHYYLYYSCPCRVMEIGSTLGVHCNRLYFSSIEAAKAAIKAVGEDRVKKYYLGIKEA